MDGRIVPFDHDLLDACAEVYVAAFAAPPWNDRWTTATARARLVDLLAVPGSVGCAWVDDADSRATAQGLAIGQMTPWETGTVFRLAEFCVHPRAQRRGIGQALLGHIEREASARGAVSISLTTSGEMASFYRDRGYRDIDGLVTLARHLVPPDQGVSTSGDSG